MAEKTMLLRVQVPADLKAATVQDWARQIGCRVRIERDGSITMEPIPHSSENIHKFPRYRHQRPALEVRDV